VSWQILTGQAWADIEKLDESERNGLADDLMAWVESGKPRHNRRDLAGTELYDDRLPSGFDVVYLADESVPYAALLRVRWAPPSAST
jgi:hypothetical protein